METPSIDELTAATGGRYEIEGVFATGGMGAVYVARHRQLGSRVAIKVLPPDVATSAVRLARFKREAALAANLSHPNIVPVFEFDAQHGLAYLVMPFVQGESLAQYLDRHARLDYATVRQFIRDVAQALAFAHGRGVVHRDVKPGNILREEATGRWLITDFGVAHTTHPGDTDLTQSGAIIGTPAYMAPEQVSGRAEIDGRADLYALASVAYEALVGSRHDPLNDAQDAAVALERARPDLRTRVAETLTAPLAVRPEQRPGSAEAWLSQLELAELKRSTPMRLVLPIALAAAALIGWLLLRGPRPPVVPDVPTVAVLPFLASDAESGSRLPLDSLLVQAFDWQLRYLPNHRVVGPRVRHHPVARAYAAGTAGLDTLLAVARDMQATLAIAGRAETRGPDDVFVQIQLHDAQARELLETADTTGSVDDLNGLVSYLVVAVFAERLGRTLTGLAASYPSGLESFTTYWRAQQAFRRGAYAEAIEGFEHVIRLDSTFAPAHFQRMIAELLDLRPTRATARIRSALDAASQHRTGLDPTSAQLLAGYEVLGREGDIVRAERMFEQIVENSPTAVDTWFVLGYVQFWYRALLNVPLGESRFAFEKALEYDPQFAAALSLAATTTVLEGDRVRAQQYFARFLALDSTSSRAELARMADSVLYRGTGAALRVIGSVARRPADVLELFGLTAGELHQPGGMRPLANAALESLWRRAGTQRDRQIAFRMRLAQLIATGRYASTDTLMQSGMQLRLADNEVDRWILLSAVTPMPVLTDSTAQRAAINRLQRAADDDPEAHWLLARWSLLYDAGGANRAIVALQRIAEDSALTSPHARSLALDVEATRSLAAGDTARALTTWEEATQQYSVEAVPFGLTASLWPLRLARAELALHAGMPELVLEIAGTFDAMVGFVDQVAWATILRLRAAAALEQRDQQLARRAYADILQVLDRANGAGVLLRDSLERAQAKIGT